MNTLAKRLQRLMQQGSLTKRDLQRWLGRPYPTVRLWVIGQQQPWGIWRDDIEQKVHALEKLVIERKHLPIPPSYSPSDRADLIEGLIRERDAKISRNRSAD